MRLRPQFKLFYRLGRDNNWRAFCLLNDRLVECWHSRGVGVDIELHAVHVQHVHVDRPVQRFIARNQFHLLDI